MELVWLFTDGSLNPRSKVGFGAFLAVSPDERSMHALAAAVRVKSFEATSSTRLELQTLLWALGEIPTPGCKLIVYSDSQNIMSLPERRARFEQNDYRSKKDRPLNHHDLYREFYRATDPLDCEFVKVRGHQASKQKDDIDKLFTLVDQASRNAVREGVRSSRAPTSIHPMQ